MLLINFPQDEYKFYIVTSPTEKVAEEILQLCESKPEEVIVFYNSAECVYYDGTRWCKSYEEGGDRIHDCAWCITREEAFELLRSSPELHIAVVGYTVPYERGVDWFT